MDDSVFENYFERCVWRGADKVPSYGELKEMEKACKDKLYELKKQDYQQYKVLFAMYGELDVKRITYCHKKLNEGMDVNDEIRMKGLLASYERFLMNLKALDRTLYERRLRGAISKGKHLSSLKSEVAKKTTKEDKPIEKKEEQVPHFVKLNIDEQQAAVLYDRLVEEHFLEDTGKDDFIYYYTGKGHQASKKLKWLGDDIVLSVLMKQLSNSFVPWKKMEQIYEGLNIKGMKVVLSKTQKDYYSHDKHVKKVQEWLR